jgi:hypothetical protein
MIRAVIADLRLLVEAGRVIASSAHPLPETQNKARVAVTQGVNPAWQAALNLALPGSSKTIRSR